MVAPSRNQTGLLIVLLIASMFVAVSAAFQHGGESFQAAQFSTAPEKMDVPHPPVDERSMAAEHYGVALPRGMSSDRMMVGMIMSRAEDQYPDRFRIREFAQMCPDSERIADTVVQRLQDVNFLESGEACTRFEKATQRCRNQGDAVCERIRDGTIRVAPNLTLSCPVDRQDVKDWCTARQQRHLDRMRGDIRQRCEDAIDDTQEATLRETMIQQCMDSLQTSLDRMETEMDARCDEQADRMASELNRMCDRRQDAYQQCRDHRQRACSFMTDAAARCSAITYEDIRETVETMAASRCQAMAYRENPPRFEHMEDAPDTAGAARDLARLERNISADHRPVVAESTADTVNATKLVQRVDAAQEGEDRIGFKIRKAFGLAAAEERQEAGQLREAAERLNQTIQRLKEVRAQVSNPEARAELDRIISRLEGQRDRLLERAVATENGAAGILSVFQ